MDPTNIPDEWLQAAFDAIGRSGTGDGDEQMRHVLAAILPLHAKQVRASIVGELEAHAAECRGDAKRWHSDRTPWKGSMAELRDDEAKYFAAAARYIFSDEDD